MKLILNMARMLCRRIRCFDALISSKCQKGGILALTTDCKTLIIICLKRRYVQTSYVNYNVPELYYK